MKRENGFYWVRICSYWVVAQWDNDRWWVPAFDVEQFDSDLTEIDERRLQHG